MRNDWYEHKRADRMNSKLHKSILRLNEKPRYWTYLIEMFLILIETSICLN